MEQNKQLLDKDGNIIDLKKFWEEKFSKQKIGIEDNGPYGYTIHLGNGRAVRTNDAGVEQFNKALKEYATKEWTTEEINKLIEEDPNKDQ